jgi:hypothetical protein
MRVPQFNLSGLMTVVAVTGVLLGACSILQRRQARCRALAHYHESRSAVIFDGSGEEVRLDIGLWEEIRGPAQVLESERHARLWRKYDQAASRPWMPVLGMSDE